jgi:amino acid adenylation domain-containing protein
MPLDPELPLARLTHMLAEAGTQVLLTQESLTGTCSSYVGHAFCMDRDWDALDDLSTQNPSSLSEAGNLAYILFTSGTTGHPKGVQIEHRSLTNLLCDTRTRFDLGAGQVMLNVVSLSFDVSVCDLLAPLVSGARLVMVPRETAYDGGSLSAALARNAATILDATPVTWQMLLDAGWTPGEGFTMLSGGDVLSPSLAERLLRSGQPVWNLYGPTETTVHCLAARIEPRDRVTIGRPIANARAYILDPHLQPVPVGVRGKLYAGGDVLARGYLNQPELTRERFIPNPFLQTDAARLYDTGDLARYLPDGRIEFLGRGDGQIKIRGIRIETGEIEAVLTEHESIRDAAVISREDGQERRLVAYVVTSDGMPPASAALRGHLRQKLPDYMVPARIIGLDSLPLTGSGKVDRRALSLRDIAEIDRSAVSIRLSSFVEQTLAAIWKEVLDLDEISMEDDFYDLGGHSIAAFQILSRIRSAFKVELPVRSIFEATTIAAFAKLLEAAMPFSATPEPESGLEPNESDLSAYQAPNHS